MSDIQPTETLRVTETPKTRTLEVSAELATLFRKLAELEQAAQCLEAGTLPSWTPCHLQGFLETVDTTLWAWLTRRIGTDERDAHSATLADATSHLEAELLSQKD